jgi:AraC-like DNA-binding protein
VHKCRHPRAGSAIYFIAIKRSVPMRLPALLACTRLRSRRSLWAMLHSSMRPGPRHASLTTLISHLGCEPQGGLYARGGTPAVRLLFDLVREADKGSGSSPADSYMQLAVYDLLGALFAPSDPSPVRASLGTSQPLSEIAYACGFRDYHTHFARKFRQRFGYSPGAAARDTVALATP